MESTRYQVSGMSCDHCVGAVKREIGELAGVLAVDVDLASGRVTVSSESALDDEAVRAAVVEAGYEVVS